MSSTDPSLPLANSRHELYAQGRAKGLTAEQSHAEAGYKPNRSNAARLNANDSIKARIQWLSQGAAEIAQIDAAFVLDGLRDNYLRATGQLDVTTGTVGLDEAPKKLCDLHAANKALELLGKHLGVFEERAETGGTATVILYPAESVNK